jgi:hypothetical protein
MEGRCASWVEPRYEGVHALMVRLIGRCTCESDAEVVQLFTCAGVECPGAGHVEPSGVAVSHRDALAKLG